MTRRSLSPLFVAIVLFVGIVAAIPSHELDWTDPELIPKLFNGTIVVDMPENEKHKRQRLTVARAYANENLAGTYGDANGSNGGIQVLGIDSAQLYNLDYIMGIFDTYVPGGSGSGVNTCSGNYRYFRTLQPINKMSQQDSFGGVGNCLRAIYVGGAPGVNIWEDTNFSGRVTNLPPGNYPSISGAGYPPTARNDKMSSFESYAGGHAAFYRDSNYGNICYNNPGPVACPDVTNCYDSISRSCPNDSLSSGATS